MSNANYVHLMTFPVATTNIFPLVNSSQGGQLVTEFNLKSRDMVAVNPDIQYAQGPSFIHSLEDFKVSLLEDPESGATASTSIIQVAPGRAVINGHYVETLAPMIVDLNEVNIQLRQKAQEPLYGNLSIGIRSYFSTEATMAGTMLVENSENIYVGVQLVVAATEDFKTPDDCPSAAERDNVIADLKLADFAYINGAVSPSSIIMNPDATRYIPSARIKEFDEIMSKNYVTVSELDDKTFYTYEGKVGWCDSTGNLMVWDRTTGQSERWLPVSPDGTDAFQTIGEAQFTKDALGNVYFVVPHKQPHADIRNAANERLHYADKVYSFPTADYASGASGIVTAAYTKQIKDIAAVINTYKQFTNGKQILFLDTLVKQSDDTLSYKFPTDLSNYNVGDYILVREDYTIYAGSLSEGSGPSTLYFVLPGGVLAVEPSGITQTTPPGVRLGAAVDLWQKDGATEPTSTSPTAVELMELFACTSYRGTANDYFELVYHRTDDTTATYYYPVTSTGPKSWSTAVLLTGGMSMATEDQIGGFYNASTDPAYADAGYVYLDNTGHLRLRDYELLRSGALAYQLGEDFTLPTNQTVASINSALNEYVNARVAFPFTPTVNTYPAMINVTIPLPKDGVGTITLYDIDSRFGTGVYLHFVAQDNTQDFSNIVINIVDCEKIRIDNTITTWTRGPVINIFRTCLYYDASVINYIRNCDVNGTSRASAFPDYPDFTGFENLTLWYSRFPGSDGTLIGPDLIVNGMEVSQPNVAMVTHDVTFWDEVVSGDNHYEYALRSITLSGSGRIIGCSIYVSNNSSQTTLVDTQHIIIGGDFILPQGSDLNYPDACVNSPLTITGVFTTAYLDVTKTKWITTETSFTAYSGVYSPGSGIGNGSIAFNSKTELLDTTYTNVDHIDGWGRQDYHIFYGGVTV